MNTIQYGTMKQHDYLMRLAARSVRGSLHDVMALLGIAPCELSGYWWSVSVEETSALIEYYR